MKPRRSLLPESLTAITKRSRRFDDLQNDLGTDEDNLREMNKRILSAVEAQYGPDSSEYEVAGGTRQSERKKPAAKPKGGTPPAKP